MALLTGMTPDGQEVPVQVDSSGRLVAEGLTGPEGPAGPTGPTGPTGPAGPAGDSQWVKNGQDISYAQGRVAIGTTSPGTTLQVGDGTGLRQAYISGAGYDLYLGASGGAAFGFASQSVSLIFNNTAVPLAIGTLQSQPVVFGAAGFERARIDSSGRLLVGTSAFSGDATIVAKGSSAGAVTQSFLVLQRGQTSPAPDLDLGVIRFTDAAESLGAQIAAQTDGSFAWGANDYPTRLVLSTTADGASSPSEAMKIDSRQRVCIKSPNGNWWALQVSDSGALSAVAV